MNDTRVAFVTKIGDKFQVSCTDGSDYRLAAQIAQRENYKIIEVFVGPSNLAGERCSSWIAHYRSKGLLV